MLTVLRSSAVRPAPEPFGRMMDEQSAFGVILVTAVETEPGLVAFQV
jgi:hypothetical protein